MTNVHGHSTPHQLQLSLIVRSLCHLIMTSFRARQWYGIKYPSKRNRRQGSFHWKETAPILFTSWHFYFV